jgi:S-adenosylmethionine/arginine decarboxylase-like enzyme
VAEDCGISAFVFLAGGHLTLHTFSFRECYFADLVYPERYDARQLRHLFDTSFPCQTAMTHTVQRTRDALHDGPVAPDRDFGPHLFLDIEDYEGPTEMGDVFRLFDGMPQRIDMTPIMRPYVIEGHTTDGQRVVSALTMIAESHIALHIFPERRMAYFDIFSCKFFDRDMVTAELLRMLPGKPSNQALVARGRDYIGLRREREPEVLKSKAWLKGLDVPVGG